jgi:MFS family permease
MELSKHKLFYGWYIVMGLAVVGVVSIGMGNVNLGLYIPPMSKELDIKQSLFGLTQTARLVGFSMSSWFIGRILDQYGARIPLAIAGAFMGVAMVGLSYTQTGWQLVALFFLKGIIGMEGAGGNLFQSVPLSRWFIRQRGKAMSMVFLGTPIGIFILCPLTQFLIDTASWRSAWLILGGGGSLAIIIVALLVIRKEPQSMGLQPDGVPPDGREAEADHLKGVQSPIEYPWTRPQAVRTFTFWSLSTVMGLRMLCISSLSLFRIPFYIEQGISPQLVAWALSAEAVVAAAIAIPAGWAVDMFQPRFVATASLCITILVFLVTMNVTTTWHVFLATVLFGAAAASFMVIQAAMWPAYFSGINIGSIRGLAVPVMTVFSAIGAPLTGVVKDATGSYIPAWLGSIVLLVVGTCLMAFTPKPKPPVEHL